MTTTLFVNYIFSTFPICFSALSLYQSLLFYCTSYILLYILYFIVHPIFYCTSYVLLYILYITVHPMFYCTSYILLYILYFTIHPIFYCTSYIHFPSFSYAFLPFSTWPFSFYVVPYLFAPITLPYPTLLYPVLPCPLQTPSITNPNITLLLLSNYSSPFALTTLYFTTSITLNLIASPVSSILDFPYLYKHALTLVKYIDLGVICTFII